MKYNIQTTLTGRVWWKPFLLYLLLSFALILPLELTLMRIDNPDNTIPLLPLFLFIAVLLALRVALEAVFTLILGRILVSSVSCNGIQPVLGGSTQEFVTLNLVCFVRTCITLGFYGPRYIKRHTDYLVEHCSIDGTGCSFSGTARSLFTYIYVGLVLPLIFWMMLFIAAAVAEQLVAESARVLPEVLMGVLGIGIFFLCIPFFYICNQMVFQYFLEGENPRMEYRVLAKLFFPERSTVPVADNAWNSLAGLCGQVLGVFCGENSYKRRRPHPLLRLF